MTIDSREAATSLQDIADIERRTRAAIMYGGSGAIFVVWGILVACGYGLTEFYPRSVRIIWLGVSILGCAVTVLIVALRMRAREARDWRIIWAMVALTAFGAAWSYVLGPIVPRQMMYAFHPSLVMLGMILAGLWLGRFFVVLGLVGIALIAVGCLQAEPWLWMAAVQSGTLIICGVWLSRVGVAR